MVHLWTGGPQPPEYTRFVLMDRFGWTPAEVKQIPLSELLTILACMDAEAKVHAGNRRLNGG